MKKIKRMWSEFPRGIIHNCWRNTQVSTSCNTLRTNVGGTDTIREDIDQMSRQVDALVPVLACMTLANFFRH